MANLFNPCFIFLLSLFLTHQAIAKSHHHHHESIKKTVHQTTTPFGTVFVFRDHLTLWGNASSKVVGLSEGTSITSALDGLRSISMAMITLKMKGMPVVRGTGDFMFVQGYIVSSPVDLQGLDVTYKVEFHLYWPES
ncbi:hypothetical protein AMTRI_Chr07g26380 [Amborella trichopoda]